MKKDTINHIMLWVIAIILGFAMNSCGARKVDKNRLEEETKTELTDTSKLAEIGNSETKTETNVKKSETVAVNDQDQTTTVKEILEPLDASKPASYTDKDGKKQDLNNAKKTTETTTKNNNTKTDISANTESVNKSEAKAKKAISVKNDIAKKADTKKVSEDIKIDREAWSVWNLLWILIPIGLIVLAVKNRMKIAGWIESIWWV